jgi:protein SCO1/2
MRRIRSAFAVLFAALTLFAPPVAAAGLGAQVLKIPLTDDRGRITSLAAWRGHPAVVTMEYANCRFICSITLQRMKDVQAAADAAGRSFDFIVVSLDPKNDTPAAWTRYRQSRELMRDNWSFVTASAEETPVLAHAFGIKYWLYDTHIMHDFRLLRLDAAGKIVKVMDSFDASADDFLR